MKKAWTSVKSFITIAIVILLFIIVIFNLLGNKLDQEILILVTNITTAVFTYYFSKKDIEDKYNENSEKVE